MNAAYTGFLSANRVKCRAYAKVPHLTCCPATPLFMRVSRKKVKCQAKLSAKARTYRKSLIYKDILLSAEVPPIGVHEFRHLRRIHARSGAMFPRPLTHLPVARYVVAHSVIYPLHSLFSLPRQTMIDKTLSRLAATHLRANGALLAGFSRDMAAMFQGGAGK